MKRTISTEDAPAAVGAYSQATTDGRLLVTAGQLPITPAGEVLDDASVAAQTRQCLRNVAAILEANGGSLADVLKTTVFLADIADVEACTDAYREFFNEAPPARTVLAVAAIPKGAAVEIEAMATVDGP